MKTSIALIAVQYLIAVIVEAAKAYLTIGLEELFVIIIFAFGRTDQFITLNQ